MGMMKTGDSMTDMKETKIMIQDIDYLAKSWRRK
jgi:hypothetical protein